MWSCLSTAIPPTSPITQWCGSGWGQAGSSTKPGAIPLCSAGMAEASRSKTRAFCSASVAVALVPVCCALREVPKRETLNAATNSPAQRTYLIIFEVIVTPARSICLVHVLLDPVLQVLGYGGAIFFDQHDV